jgi:hypothetical protein
MSPERAEQFHSLRIRLDKLGYLDPISPDAVPLILKLLNDLVQTTESCQRLKTSHDRAVQEKRNIEVEVRSRPRWLAHCRRRRFSNKSRN